MNTLEKSDPILKILVPYPTAHDVPSGVTMALDKISRELSKNFNVKIIRLIFQSERVLNLPKPNGFNEVLDLHDFDNAIDVLKKIQPDLIYTVPYVEFIALSFIHAAKLLKIPTVGLIMIGFEKELKLKSTFFSNFRKFFDNTVPTDIYVNETSFLRRIKFIFYKLNFMRKTFSKIFGNISSFSKTQEILFSSFSKNPFYSKSPLSKHFVLNKFQKHTLLKYGFKENDVIITGHPIFDTALQENLNKKFNQQKSHRIIFSPDTLAEAGIWTREKQEKTIKKIVKTLNSKDHFSLIVKIHPSSAKMNFYKQIIHEINPKIPIFQKGSIDPFFKNSDLIIAYSPYSTSLIYALIYRIPIILTNFYDDVDDIFNLVKEKVAIECKDVKSIVSSIDDFIEKQEFFEENRENYIKNYLYSDDGKASERIALEIINMVKNLKN